MNILDLGKSIRENQRLTELFTNQNRCMFSITHEGVVQVWEGKVNNIPEIEAEYASIKNVFETVIANDELNLFIGCKQVSGKNCRVDLKGTFGVISFSI